MRWEASCWLRTRRANSLAFGIGLALGERSSRLARRTAPLRGEGWTLERNEGWALVPGERLGDYALKSSN